MKIKAHISLHRVPGIGDFRILLVRFDGSHHLCVHTLIHFGSKDVSQDSTDQHHDKDDEQDDKEDDKHASDLPVCTQCSQEGDDRHHQPGCDQDGSGGDIQVAAQQSLHERLVGQRPYSDREDNQAASLFTIR